MFGLNIRPRGVTLTPSEEGCCPFRLQLTLQLSNTELHGVYHCNGVLQFRCG